MPLLDPIERRSPRGRLLLFLMYAVLAMGGLTMVYPFGVMLGGSLRGATDLREKGLVPRYLYDDHALWARFCEALMNERLQSLNISHGLKCREFSDIPKLEGESPTSLKTGMQGVRLVGDSPSSRENHFFLSLANAPHWMYTIGFSASPVTRTTPFVLRDFRAHLRAKYKTLGALDKAVGGGLESWDSVVLNPESYLSRRETTNPDGLMAEWVEFKQTADPSLRVWMSVEGFFTGVFLPARHGTVEAFNARWGTNHKEFSSIPVPERAPPEDGALREDWEIFVREVVGLQWVGLDDEEKEAYERFSQTRPVVPSSRSPVVPFSHDLEAFLRGWTDPHGVHHKARAEHLILLSIEAMWREHLARHEDPAAVASAPRSPPYAALHAEVFHARKNEWRREFMARNYRAVFDHLLIRGRGIWNTAVYCFFAVLGALVVNPLAAYALSRFKMRGGSKIMLFCLCTMAFPPMVTQIPGLLMMRHLNMLNTFYALLLPGLANGYSIFLLKGFFDSQPRELYEAAALDGAGEWRIFWGIAMNLSRPILAVVGLNAFTLAYSNFMLAFVVCQDERMWTMMVWLYQLQQNAGQAVMYASLVVAAIPSLCVFLFCQRVILRGIVVPVEK